MLSRAPYFAMIAAMKRTLLFLPLLCLCALFICVFPRGGTVSAETEPKYAVVNESDVLFYERADRSTALFVLPYTYFVRILATDGEFLRVQYASAEGYCLASDVIAVDFTPVTPYLVRTVDFLYKIDDPGKAGSEEMLTITRTFDYYGHIYENGYLYYYVLADGAFKRIPAERLLDYQLNREYEQYVAVSAEAERETGGLSAAAIVAICVACVAAVSVAVLVARGKRPPAYDPDKAEF